MITGNSIKGTRQAGIGVVRYLTSTAFSTGIQILNNKLDGCDTLGGTGTIDLESVINSNVMGNTIDNSSSGSGGIYCGNLTNSTISFLNNPTAIYAITGTTDSSGSSYTIAASAGLYITGNTIKSTTNAGAGAIQLNPDNTKPYSQVVINGNTFDGLAGAALYAKSTYVTGIVNNNLSLSGSVTYTYSSMTNKGNNY